MNGDLLKREAIDKASVKREQGTHVAVSMCRGSRIKWAPERRPTRLDELVEKEPALARRST